MGGKGGGGTDWQTVAGTNAYNAASQGQSWDAIAANQPKYLEASRMGYDKWMEEQAAGSQYEMMMASMMKGMGGGGESGGGEDPYAAAREEARISDLTGKRDAFIGGYFDAANQASNYVTEKISGEKANAALMGVDYTMNDELKNERISNYFSTLWSEGNQQEMEGSFGEIGSGGFEQTIWRGEGVESGPTGEVGEEKAGGAIKAKKKNLMDDEDALGNSTALGA